MGLRGVSYPVFERAELHEDDVIAGPALVVDPTGTTLLDRGSRARVHATGGLVVEVRP